MTFLKKLGGILANVTALFMGFAPLVTKAYPQSGGVVETVSKDLADVGNIVVSVEALGQLKGLDGAAKAAASGPLVAQVLLASSLLAGKKVADQSLFLKGCTEIGGGVADVLNSVHQDSTQVVTSKLS